MLCVLPSRLAIRDGGFRPSLASPLPDRRFLLVRKSHCFPFSTADPDHLSRFQLVTGRTWRGTAFGGVKGRTEIPGLVEGLSTRF